MANGPPTAPTVVAQILLNYHDNGALSISGNIGDVRLALQILDAAREAVSHRLGKPSLIEPHGAGLVVPECDVQAEPSPLYPIIPEGDRRRV